MSGNINIAKNISTLRKRAGLTQDALAEFLGVTKASVSKWETGKGYPDITLLEPIAKVFGVSLAELFSGTAVTNLNRASNLLRSKFYVCPVCGNVLYGVGEAAIHCHGVMLTPCEAEAPDAGHAARIDVVEDEYHVQIDHAMTREHYISFIAAIGQDAVQIIKQYPEQDAAARFKRAGVRRIAYYCNRDGLFMLTPISR